MAYALSIAAPFLEREHLPLGQGDDVRRFDQWYGGGGDPILRGGGEVGSGIRIGGVRRARDQGSGLHIDLGQLIGQQFGGGGFPHAKHLQGVEVADDLAGLGPVSDTRLNVAQGLGVGGDLDTGATPLLISGMNSSPISSLNSSACRLIDTLSAALEEPGRP